MKILFTGAAGFIGRYAVRELIQRGHTILAIDNFSKYGRVALDVYPPAQFTFVEGDAKNTQLLTELARDCDHVVAAAAKIGGISYFHEFAYDLLAENERIIAATFDAAIAAYRGGKGRLQKITVLSSSMVFENATQFPTPEQHWKEIPPPNSAYGFQKLACEYYAYAAHQQYQLPYTIVRPFNCVGLGEARALSTKEIYSGDVKLAMSHVVPDLIQKMLRGQDPVHILGDGDQVRCYTYGGDIARGIATCVESPAALNNDFNISTATAHTVLELAHLIWQKIYGSGTPFRYTSDLPYAHDVQRRIPDVSKAAQILGFTATTPLDTVLDELIPWVKDAIAHGTI